MLRTRLRLSALGVLITVSLVAAACSSSPSNSANGGTTTTAAASASTTVPAPTTTTSSLETNYGAFTEATQSGSSDGVVKVPAGAKAGLVAATATGSGNFVIEGLDSSNKTTDLIVNAVGSYTGTTAFGFGLSRGPPVSLKVTASGPWTVKLSPISTAPVLSSPANGTGDTVYQWNGNATSWKISNSGYGRFVVTFYGSGLLSTDVLVNEDGGYNGTVPVKSGPAVVTVESGGTWSITF